jgi:hypothetical protein
MWYLGDINFKDTLYMVNNNGSTFTTNEVLNISNEGNQPIDLIKPAFDNLSSLYSFINKTDGSLWLLDVNRALSQ